jgi:hypothetical protein
MHSFTTSNTSLTVFCMISLCTADLKAGYFVRAMAQPDSSSTGAPTIALAMGIEVQECPEGSYQPYEGEDPVYNCTSCGQGLKTDGTGSTSSEACCEWEGSGRGAAAAAA